MPTWRVYDTCVLQPVIVTQWFGLLLLAIGVAWVAGIAVLFPSHIVSL
jgi:hypothetical protein